MAMENKKRTKENFRLKKEFLYVCFGLLLILFIFFPEVFIEKKLLIKTDLAGRFLSFSYYIRRHGFSVWSPIQMGYPYGINPILGLFSPLIFFSFGLSYIISPEVVFTYSVIFCYFFSFLFMYAYMRIIKVDKISSFFSAVVFTFNELMISYIDCLGALNTFLWLPLILFFLELFFQKRKRKYAIITGIILGFQLLSGHIQYAYWSVLLTGIYFIFKMVCLKEKRRKILSLFLIFSIALGISAVVLLPGKELISFSNRLSATYKDIVAKEDSFLSGKAFISIFLYNTNLRKHNEEDFYPLYMGFIPGLIFLLSLFNKKRRYMVYFYLFLTFFILFLCWRKTSFLYHFIYLLQMPLGFNVFKEPLRAVFFLLFAISVLSGIGMNAFGDLIKKRSLSFFLRLFLIFIAVFNLYQMRNRTTYVNEVLCNRALPKRWISSLPSFLKEDCEKNLVRFYDLHSNRNFYNRALISGGYESSGGTGIPFKRYLQFLKATIKISPYEKASQVCSLQSIPHFFVYPNLLRLTNTKYVVVFNGCSDEFFTTKPYF